LYRTKIKKIENWKNSEMANFR